MRKVLGFTLIELMIVVAVVALLAAVALTNYQKQVRKSKRAEARSLVADFSARQEKRRQNVATYGDCTATAAGVLVTQTCTTYNGTLVNYGIGITFPTSGNCPGGQARGSANSYILTATPKAGSDQNNDTACTAIVLTNNCGTIERTPAACW